ncbi:MAG: SMC-Scp complex subunit ScpB [Clostridiales bacterium]|nr:SMC-Scp complex subunit ScpB [Clostridiales bacterium]
MDIEKYKKIIEAILFTMGNSVEADSIARALEIDRHIVIDCIHSLQREYEESGRGIMIVELDGAFQMCTRPEMYEYLIRIAKQPRKYVLTDVVLETLSIIAYKQPITRVEIERIRGVSCEHAVNRLVEFGLIKELGRLDAPGRPILFGTTEEFLRVFGVRTTDELPELSPTQLEEFKEEAEEEMQMELPI